ncbi:porin, partial [Bacillus licheniformis]|nr:porin [Bacillus licheniformis]
MNKTLIVAAAAASFATVAHAQSSVTLYGDLDAALLYTSRSLDSATGGNAGRQFALTDTGMTPTNFGITGTEDLGGGLKAIFTLENGFNPNTGALGQGNRMFGRQAFVGLESARWGTLTLGRQTPLTFDYLDPLSTAYLAMSWFAFHPGNIDGLAATGNVPYNNSVKYRSPTFAGFSAAATLALGNT